jgi:Domain of unknown function (DUF6089)
MKRSLIINLLLVCSFSVFAQNSLDAGLFLSTAHYLGDLAPDVPVLSQTRPAVGFNVRYFTKPRFSLRGNVINGSLAGADEFTRNQPRNYRFRTNFTEISTQLEWHPFAGPRRSYTFLERNIKEPYVFAGIGYLATTTRVGINLTEKAAQNHQNWMMSFGAGYRLEFGKKILFDAEFGMRPALNDYLDGLMTITPDVRNDWYLLAGVHFNYLIFARD